MHFSIYFVYYFSFKPLRMKWIFSLHAARFSLFVSTIPLHSRGFLLKNYHSMKETSKNFSKASLSLMYTIFL